jgi:hypothetical protein
MTIPNTPQMQVTTIGALISQIGDLNQEAVIYAKKQNGRFLSSSEAVLIELRDEDDDLSPREIASKYCPGFDYFLEVFLVIDVMEELDQTAGYKPLTQQVDRVIQYAESAD